MPVSDSDHEVPKLLKLIGTQVDLMATLKPKRVTEFFFVEPSERGAQGLRGRA